MSTPVIQTSFASGEVSPSLFGHVDLARMKSSAATMRNMFVRYTGGAYSRAGTAFVGYSKQTGRAVPPRLITFQFGINQGLALEFGNYYMRVIYNAGHVTETAIQVTAATQASPCVITASATGSLSATPNNAGVYSSYAPGEQIVLAGGVYSFPAILQVQTTTLLLTQVSTPGASGVYAPGNTITLAGGTASTPAKVSITSTTVVSATIAVAGTTGTDGTAIVTGTTGTGTMFQANVTITGGAITAVNSIVTGGAYTVNPTAPALEPVTGAGLTGAKLNLVIGVNAATISVAGSYTANPPGGLMTQSSTTGAGVGATFAYSLFGPATLSVANPGAYTSFPANPVSQATTSGSGAGATFTMSSGSVAAYNAGDWLYLSNIGGMTVLNGRTVVIGAALGGGQYSIYDVFGNPINTTGQPAFSSTGSAARIYTLATPYAENDLKYLKFTQSADVVSLTCVNQTTGAEYPPYDLARYSDSFWSLVQVDMSATVSAPVSASATATAMPVGTSYSSSAYYQYVATAVNPSDGTESVASPIASLPDAVDISATSGTITLTCAAVQGVNQYRWYKATPVYAASRAGATVPPPVGSLFGYVGSSYGTQFNDSNTIADMAKAPPLHKNPFARGQIFGATPVNPGSGYTTANATINTSTGSGAILTPVVVGGKVVSFYLQNQGKNYAASDTVTISGNGSGATASLNIGPQSGTYPSVVAYFQERRAYAATINSPDTYFMSQPGSFTNFDSRIPTTASDSIIGTPWSTQVNGIQFMVSMPGGLVVLTGLSAWQLTGAGGSSLNPQPITPSSQQAQPQAYNGCSATVPPIKINYDIIYVQAKGSIYRDLAYQFYTNIYTGTDLTQNSSHLFMGHTIIEHAWCEEPYKILWSVRDDGVLLSLTYLKEQEISGWARHDTYGLVKSVCSVTEPPVDALYLAVNRNIANQASYIIERMDNRLWNAQVESTWCVDCGIRMSQPTPNANLWVGSPYGAGIPIGVSGLIGGAGYSASTTATLVDDNGEGPGTGATVALSIIGGVINNITIAGGANYIAPSIVFFDPQNTGAGASATVTLGNHTTLAADAPVFSISDIGSVVRAGGGIATITAYVSPTVVMANITTPLTAIQPNSVSPANPNGVVQRQPSGAWTKTALVSQVTGLTHLANEYVMGLADGNPIGPLQVSASGVLALPTPASSVLVGLGFQCQLQSVYLDAGEPTAQGQRKKVSAATVRVEASRGIKVGSNQIDGSAMSPPAVAPKWRDLDVAPELGMPPFGGNVVPLFTGDIRVPVSGGYQKPGQVAVQQDNPLPMQILALIPEDLAGDMPEQRAAPRNKKSQGG